MKRIKSVFTIGLAILALMVVGIPSLPVQAAADITVSVTASPSEMTGAGSTNVTVTVGANVGVESIALAGPGISSPVNLGSLDEGQSTNHTVTVSLSAEELGAPLTYIVTYMVGGESRSASGAVTIKKKGGNPKLNLTVTSDKKAVEPGEKVTFTYTVQNGGDVDLTDIVIKDTAVVSGNIASGLALSPGQNQQYTKTVTVNEDITSSPTATYTAQGTGGTASATPIKITASTPSLSITAKADKDAVDQGEEVNFTITLKNTSAVAINGIAVKDDAGNEVRKDISLNPNASTNISYKTTVSESHNYYFVAEFPSGGSTKTEQSAEVPVTVSGSFLFTLSVTPVNQNPEIPGDVEFKITLTADGSITLKDIVITEAKLGQVETLSELAPGTKEITKTLRVEEAGNYLFSATATDEAGTAYTASSLPVALGVAAGDPNTANPSEGGDALGTFFKVLIIIVILIVVAAVALVILMVIDKKKRAQRAMVRGNRPGMSGGPGGTRPGGRDMGSRPGGARPRMTADGMPMDGDNTATRRIQRVVTPESAQEQLRASRGGSVPRSALPSVGGDDENMKVYRPSRRPYEGASSYPMDDPEIAARLEAARKRRFEVSPEEAQRLSGGAIAGAAVASIPEAEARTENGTASVSDSFTPEDLPSQDPFAHDRPRRAFGQVLEEAERVHPTPSIDDDAGNAPARGRSRGRRLVEDDLDPDAPSLDDVLVDEDQEEYEDESPRGKRGLFGRKPRKRDDLDDLFGDDEEDSPRPSRQRKPRGRGREEDFFPEEEGFDHREHGQRDSGPADGPSLDEFSYAPRRRNRK
jgi:hypothetical protein